jgi:hypothetical protein
VKLEEESETDGVSKENAPYPSIGAMTGEQAKVAHESSETDCDVSTKSAWPFPAKHSRKQSRQIETFANWKKQQPPLQFGALHCRKDVSFTALSVELGTDNLNAPPSVAESISWKKQKATWQPPSRIS